MKKNYFYFFLIIIYLLFLSKDMIMGFFKPNIGNFIDKEAYYEMEYKDLSKLLDIPYDNYNVTYSKLINRDIYEFYDKVTILKGKKDDIRVGSLVVDQMGVVGLIKKCYDNYSEVTLLSSSNMALSVKVNNSYGILSGENGDIIVKNIKGEDEITIGTKVYTSGLTSIKGGILVGSVEEIKKDSLGLEYILKINPSSNLTNLSYVGVIS